MADDIAAYLATKVDEYRILVGPLERAAREMELSHHLVRAKVESEIAGEVPVLGALAEILDISLIDMLMSQDRYGYMNDALGRAGLTAHDVVQQLRQIGPPPRNEDLEALGLPS